MSKVTSSILELRGVQKSYGTRVRQQVLFDIDLQIAPGEFVAIVGQSGSGKTTLLNLLGLLDRPSAGEILLFGQPVSTLDEDARTLLRRDRLGFIFQFHYLLPGFTVEENAWLPLLMRGTSVPEPRRDEIRALLTQVGLGPHLTKYPDQLSGGQAQRAAIVRALSNRPALVLADEPTGSLDSRTSDEVFDILRQLNRMTATSFIMVTHQLELADRADRIIRIADGRIVNPWQN